MLDTVLVGYRETPQGHEALAMGTVLAEASAAKILPPSSPAAGLRGIAPRLRPHPAELIVEKAELLADPAPRPARSWPFPPQKKEPSRRRRLLRGGPRT